MVLRYPQALYSPDVYVDSTLGESTIIEEEYMEVKKGCGGVGGL